MVRESRSEYLANRLFQSAVDYSIHAVLGEGFKLRRERTVDIPFLTTEREQELGFSWNEYMDVLDWTGENDQSELLQLLLKKLYVDGEFIAEVSYDATGRKRLVEIDPCRIPPSITPHELPRGNRMENGREFDPEGRCIAYWVTPLPLQGQGYTALPSAMRVPADRIIHIYQKRFSNQSRGIPYFSSTLPLFRATRQFDANHLKSSQIASKFLVAFNPLARDAGETPEYGVLNPIPGVSPEDWETLDYTTRVRMTVDHLNQGDTVVTPPDGFKLDAFSPNNNFPSGEYKDFVSAQQRQALGALYPLITSDTSNLNFVSGRMLFNAAQDEWRGMQKLLIDKMFRPLFASWLDVELNTPAKYPESVVFAKRTVIRGYKFTARKFAHIQTREEAAANDLAIKNQTKTPGQVVEENGGDYKEFVQRLAREREMEREILGEELDHGTMQQEEVTEEIDVERETRSAKVVPLRM